MEETVWQRIEREAQEKKNRPVGNNGIRPPPEPPPLAGDDAMDAMVYDGPSLVAAEIPEPEWLVPGFVASGVMTMLVGVGKLGKSVLAHQLCVAVACGGKWLDQAVPREKTLYVNFEDPLGLTRSRAIQQFSPEKLTPEYHAMEPPWGFSFNRFLAWLARYIAKKGIALVVIDPLGIAANWRDENDNSEVGRTCRSIQEVAVTTGAAILVVHHTRKSGGEYGLEVRGGGAIFAGIQGFLSFKRCSEGRYQLDALNKMPGEHGGEKHLLLRREPLTLTWHVEGEVSPKEVERQGHLITVMLAIKANPQSTRAELRAHLGLSEPTLRRYLKELDDKGLVFEDTRMHQPGDEVGRPPKGLFLTKKGLEQARMEAD